jgi:hypothetical protein
LLTGITRLALSLNAAPNSTARWFSMTALGWIAVVFYAIRVHTRDFGSYKQLLPICVLLNAAAQTVSIFAIVLAVLTGDGNIFSADEYGFGNGMTWFHAAAHLFFGLPVGSVVIWIFGSLVLWIVRKQTRSEAEMPV